MKTVSFRSMLCCLFFVTSLTTYSQTQLSSIPTLAKLKSVFSDSSIDGKDIFSKLSSVIKLKDDAVPALREYMNIFSLKDELTGEEPNRLWGVLALEAIGTQEAFNIRA